MVSEARFVGLDAGRDKIEASVRPTGEIWSTQSGYNGMTQVAETLFGIQPQLVALQANGNFELPLAGILLTFGLPVALVQPRKVREFARAIGKLGRVEQKPAGLLAQFAEFVKPEMRPLPEDLVEELKHLRARRTEILEMIALERSRCGNSIPTRDRDVQAHIHFMERSLASIDAKFSRQVRASRIWH